MFESFEQARAYCNDHGIQMVDFKTIDLTGRWRHVTIPIGRFTRDILEDGIGFDGSNYGFAPVEKSDMIFIPDLSTAILDPFVQVPTLSMIGDVFVIDTPNRRFEQDPRAVATKAEEYLKSTGTPMKSRRPRIEFYVFDHVSHQVKPQISGYEIDVTQAEWNSGEGYPNPRLQNGQKRIPYNTAHGCSL